MSLAVAPSSGGEATGRRVGGSWSRRIRRAGAAQGHRDAGRREETPGTMRRPARALGEHSRAVSGKIGHGVAEVGELAAGRII